MTAPLYPTALRWIAPLLLACSACDAPEPDVELREGQTATFKTTNTDQSFTWKGCEPPWGPDPYSPEGEPDEGWRAEVGARIEPDLPAHALAAWRGSEAMRECDAGCASLELAWTGDARPDETRHELGKVQPLGRCDDELVAVAVEVAVSTSFLCACD